MHQKTLHDSRGSTDATPNIENNTGTRDATDTRRATNGTPLANFATHSDNRTNEQMVSRDLYGGSSKKTI